MLITGLWVAVHVAVTWVLVRLYTRRRGTGPAHDAFETPHRMVVPSIVYLFITAAMGWALTALLPAGSLHRSIWWSDLRPQVLLLGLAAGCLPAVTAGLAMSLSPARLDRRGMPGARRWLAVLPVLAANALVEELAYRNIPLGLCAILPAAFVIPLCGFILIHVLEAGRPKCNWRMIHLICGAALFFVVACRCGLVAASICHAAVNVGSVIIAGQWNADDQGLPAIERCRFAGAGVGMLAAATAVLWLPV